MLRVSYKELFYFTPSLPQKKDTDDRFLIALIIAACMLLINKMENKYFCRWQSKIFRNLVALLSYELVKRFKEETDSGPVSSEAPMNS